MDITAQIAACRWLGEQASIEPFIEQCRYVGFIIQVPDDALERHRASDLAISTFRKVIESRIENKDFTDLYIHPASIDLDPRGVPRVVFDPQERVVVIW